MDTRISGKTRLLGVFGTPIKHSGSPVMYNFSFNYYGIDCVYLAFDCGESQMKDSLTAMRRLNMRGGECYDALQTGSCPEHGQAVPCRKICGGREYNRE